jgi:hypothetical protein
MALGQLRAQAFGFHPRHAVQFYEEDAFLQRTVAEYLAAGLRVGQPAIAITTEAHWAGFEDELRLRGIEPDRLVLEHRLLWLDARRMLATFMVGSMPDRDRFFAQMDPLIARISQRCGRQTVRACGEMVNILWQEGNADAAVALEEVWNEAANRYRLTLLCAYAMPAFRASDRERFNQICRLHNHVFPADSFAAARDEESRNREIARLQHRAQALDAEIEHRRRLEAALRVKTAELDQLRALLDASRAEPSR